MSLGPKADTVIQNSQYAGPAVIAGGSILTFNQWMGLLGLLFSVLLGLATLWFTVRVQKRREVREIELHQVRLRNELAAQERSQGKSKYALNECNGDKADARAWNERGEVTNDGE